jgi:hypothetical protein
MSKRLRAIGWRWCGVGGWTLFRWVAVCITAMAWAVPADAQLPGGCSSADQERYAEYSKDAVSALLEGKGNSTQFIALTSKMESGLSTGCRAALDREQPARVRCALEERNVALEHYKAYIVAVLQSDPMRPYVVLEHLEASVSSACWLALRRPDNPGIRRGCSDRELEIIASYDGSLNRASLHVLQRFLQRGEFELSEFIDVARQRQARLSPACNNALDRAAVETEKSKESGKAAPPPGGGVNDHGGGTFSAPGLGACTPGGCMAY